MFAVVVKLLIDGGMIPLPWRGGGEFYLTTRAWEPEILTGCGGMRTRQIPSAGAPVSRASQPSLGGSALRHTD